MELTVLTENHDYVVCIKPHGVESESQMPRLLTQQLGHEPFLPVHRLDRETGGVMVYACHSKAAAFFSRQIGEGKMEKTYLAVVNGCPEETQGMFEDLLFRDARRNKSYVVKRQRKGVKKALLSYQVLNTVLWDENPVSLVKIRLHTGRTHQIRVQFSSRQMPLWGDRKYGGKGGDTLALWSETLSFFTSKGEWVTFESEPLVKEPWTFFDEIKK